MPVAAGLERLVAGVNGGDLAGVQRDVATGLRDRGGVSLRADQRCLGPFDFAGEVAHVVGADLQSGPVGGLRHHRELAVEQLPSGVADDPRPEVLQLAAGRGVERHRLHRASGHRRRIVERAQPATHLTGGALGERHRQHLAGRDVPGRHQVGDAAGDRAGLAGPGAGQHAHRPAGGEHRLALLVVEVVDEPLARRAREPLTAWRIILAGRGDKSRQPPRARLGISAASDTLRAI